MNKFLDKQYNFTRLILYKWFVYCAITCMALGLRLHYLDHESLFMDEIHQVSYYQGTFSEIIKGAARQQQPPLDYWVGAFFYKFSKSDYVTRLPAALWGTGAVLLLMILSNALASWPIAAFAGFIMALSPFHIYFSQDARPYSISIFFLLAMLTSLRYLLTSDKVKTISYFILFCLCFGFLLTRSLSPLVTCISLAIILFIKLVADIAKNGLAENMSFHKEQTRLVVILFLLLAAIFLYLPFFLQILHSGQRYLNTTASLNLAYLISKLSTFSFNDILQAWAVQLEPFTILFTILCGLSPVFIFREKNKNKRILIYLLAAILPIAFFIHYTAFRIHTDAFFRPPYAIYILPLALLLSSYSLDKIKLLLARLFQRNFLKRATVIVSVIVISIAVITLADFKSIRKKSNWRDVGKYLDEQYGAESLIVFSTLEPLPHWQPVFYGFDRYYYGQSHRITMSKSIEIKNHLKQMTLRPVLVIFHYRDYYLTNHSHFPFMPGIRHTPFEWQLSQWPQDLILKSFTGFSLITLNENDSDISYVNTADQIHYMIDSMIPVVPQDAALVEYHIFASSLTPPEYTQHKLYHLEQAKKLARKDQFGLITKEEKKLLNKVVQ